MWPLGHHRSNSPAGPQRHEQPKPNLNPSKSELRKWFEKVDKDGSGHITAVELQQALEEGGMFFSVGTAAHIIRQVDRKGTGTITFSEFESLHVFLASVEEEFRRLRADAAGRVAVDEVVRMLVAQGYPMDGPLRQALFNRFDPLRAGSLGLQEFLALTLFLRSATSTFKAFDPSNTGSVTLSYSQFLYATVNCV